VPLRYAILIDGGFVKRRWSNGFPGRHAVGADYEAFVEIIKAHAALAPHQLHRAYFYDAKPLSEQVVRPLDKSVVNFSGTDTAARNKALHADLVRRPFLALRFGELACNGWRINPRRLRRAVGPMTVSPSDLQPNIQQKGVDMRIGLDIASLTLKKIVDIIVLVTADSDFVPAMKFARREGAQLFLVNLKHGIKEPMFEHADLIVDVELPVPTGTIAPSIAAASAAQAPASTPPKG
jgi:uncharacterized LabA/DUF88 family protein